MAEELYTEKKQFEKENPKPRKKTKEEIKKEKEEIKKKYIKVLNDKSRIS